MRADGTVVQDDTMMYQFQFTLQRGERRSYSLILQAQRTFQSTLPRGERLYDVYIVDITIVTSSFLRM